MRSFSRTRWFANGRNPTRPATAGESAVAGHPPQGRGLYFRLEYPRCPAKDVGHAQPLGRGQTHFMMRSVSDITDSGHWLYMLRMTHGRPKLVILRSPPFLLADDEGSPQFAGNIRWLTVQSNCRDSSAPKNGGPRMTWGRLFHSRRPVFGCTQLYSQFPRDCGRARPQRSGTRTTIVSFTRAMSEENESLPTSFIGWTRAVRGFTVTRNLACGSRNAWKETTQSGWPAPSRSIGSEIAAGSPETGFHTICTNDAVGERGARFRTGL